MTIIYIFDNQNRNFNKKIYCMKRIFTLVSALAIAGAASAVDVTFKVNMNNETVSANGVHLAGNFADPDGDGTANNPAYADWDPSAISLTDNGSGVYEVTLDLEAGHFYEFKYVNDNDWPGVESVPAGAQVQSGSGNDNRWVYVDGVTTLEPVAFAGMADIGKYGVALRVNLATETINPFGIHIAGNFQGWDPSSTMMYSPDGSFNYKLIVQVDPGDTLTYKFINGDTWNDNEIVPAGCEVDGNRQFANIMADSNMLNVCFAACDECQTANVTFSVDMSNEVVDPAGVFLMGTVTDWDDGEAMTDNGDGTWSITLAKQPFTLYEYKFKNGGSWESLSNRTINFTQDTSVQWCFNQETEACPNIPDPSNVTFKVLIPDTLVDSVNTGVYLMGGFTNPSWQDGAIQMTQDGSNPNLYSTTVEISGDPTIPFKFVINDPLGGASIEESAEFAQLGCGVDQSGGFTDNRQFIRTSNDTTMCFTYNTCDDCGVSSVGDITTFEGVSVYPNPTENNAVIYFQKADAYTVYVYDMTGKVVEMTQVNGNNVQLNSESYNNGIYIVKTENRKGAVNVQKLIVQ